MAYRTGTGHVTPVGHGNGSSRAQSRIRCTGHMRDFLEWFNSPPETDGVLRAATAQLWFSTVHPFEDGNGLFARAITGMAPAQSQRSPMRLYSMSHQILQESNTYCRDLEKATLETTGGYDTNTWLSRFARCFGQAMDDALEALSAAPGHQRCPGGAVCRAAKLRPDEKDRPATPQPQASPRAGAEPLITSTREEACTDSMANMVRTMPPEESTQGIANPRYRLAPGR